MNYSGGFVDETVALRARHADPVRSATAGDFDNDMDIDLYLACRTGASNIPNILYENLGNGTFQQVPTPAARRARSASPLRAVPARPIPWSRATTTSMVSSTCS